MHDAHRKDPRGTPRPPWGAIAVALFFAVPLAAQVLEFSGAIVDRPGAGLDGASATAVTADGRHVFVAGRDDDALNLFLRDATRDQIAFQGVLEDGVGGVAGLAGAAALAVSPDGRHVYVAGAIDDALAVFVRDATRDEVAFVETQEAGVGGVVGLDGASGVAVAPDGRQVYVTGEVDSALAVFARDATADGLAFREAHFDGQGGVVGLAGASAVVVAADGRNVYATGSLPGAVAVFARDASADELAFVEAQVDGIDGVYGLAGARGLALAPDGATLYVAAADADAVAVFTRGATGRLSFRGAVQVGPPEKKDEPTALAVDPTGTYLFVTGRASGDLIVWRRLADARLLRPIERHAFDTGIPGLRGAAGIALSPEGLDLFVASTVDDALTLFDFVLFADGFERGDLSSWSFAEPGSRR